MIVQLENQTLASTTYQNYFKLYKKISGCTGTAATESEEFFEIYNLTIVSVPTNNAMIRKDFNDQIFRSEVEKNIAIVSIKFQIVIKKDNLVLMFSHQVLINQKNIQSFLKAEKINHTVSECKKSWKVKLK